MARKRISQVSSYLLVALLLCIVQNTAMGVQMQSLAHNRLKLFNKNTISADSKQKIGSAIGVAASTNVVSNLRQQQQESLMQQNQEKSQSTETANSDSEESLSSLMQAYTKVGESEEKKQEGGVSEEEAMVAFSSAKLNGIKIMDLPDQAQSQKQQAEKLNEQQEIAVFQANEMDKQKEEENKKIEEKQSQDSQQTLEQQVLQLATQISGGQEQTEVKQQPKEEPSATQSNAQAALDEVQIQIPDGMQIKSHMGNADADSSQQQGGGAGSDQQQKNQQQEKSAGESQLDPAQQAQQACEQITVKDTTKKVAGQEEKPPPKIIDSLFDKNEAAPAQDMTIQQEQVFQPMFDPEQQAPKAPERTPESEQSIANSQAASEFVTVKQVSGQTNQNQGKDEPIQPKYLKVQQSQPGVNIQVQLAEPLPIQNNAPQHQDETNVEKQITGSEGMWDSQLEMEHITGKLTRPADYKPKSVLEAERKIHDKLEKQRIRDELLRPDPITDFDTKLYSDSLATKSVKSKSANQIAAEKEEAENQKQRKADEAKRQLEEIQKQNSLYQKQLEQEENVAIANAQKVRVEAKNEEDMQNMEDLKSLEKLQRGNQNTQVQGLTDQIELEETEKAENQQVKQAQTDLEKKFMGAQ